MAWVYLDPPTFSQAIKESAVALYNPPAHAQPRSSSQAPTSPSFARGQYVATGSIITDHNQQVIFNETDTAIADVLTTAMMTATRASDEQVSCAQRGAYGPAYDGYFYNAISDGTIRPIILNAVDASHLHYADMWSRTNTLHVFPPQRAATNSVLSGGLLDMNLVCAGNRTLLELPSGMLCADSLRKLATQNQLIERVYNPFGYLALDRPGLGSRPAYTMSELGLACEKRNGLYRPREGVWMDCTLGIEQTYAFPPPPIDGPSWATDIGETEDEEGSAELTESEEFSEESSAA